MRKYTDNEINAAINLLLLQDMFYQSFEMPSSESLSDLFTGIIKEVLPLTGDQVSKEY